MVVEKKILYLSLHADFSGGCLHVDQLINNLSDNFDIYCAAPIEKTYDKSGLKGWVIQNIIISAQ